MRSTAPLRVAFLLILILFLLTPARFFAQGDLRGNKGIKGPGSGGTPRTNTRTTTPPSSSAPKSPSNTREVVKVRTEYVRIATVSVVAEPNATITLTPVAQGRQRRGAQPQTKKAPPDKSIVSFDAPHPGPYIVKAVLDGYTPAEHQFVVEANRAHDVELNLAPITYNVAINFNAPSGEVLYSTKKTGVPNVVKFSNGRVVLPELQRGIYDLEVRPDDASYNTLRTSIEVPAHSDYTLELKRPVSDEEFSWNSLNDWSLPPGWSLRSGRLAAKEKGMALPRADSFRFYKDFELSTDVRMVNGVAVSFALRARDAKQYYLIQLTGKNADEPYVLRAFVVRDGVEQPLGQTRRISQLAETIKPGKDFNVLIRMKDNTIHIDIIDSETAEPKPVGILSDPGKAFPIGAVGLVVRTNEEFEVGPFTVCTPTCAKAAASN